MLCPEECVHHGYQALVVDRRARERYFVCSVRGSRCEVPQGVVGRMMCPQRKFAPWIETDILHVPDSGDDDAMTAPTDPTSTAPLSESDADVDECMEVLRNIAARDDSREEHREEQNPFEGEDEEVQECMRTLTRIASDP